MGDLDNLEAFNELDRGSVDKQRKLIRALTMPYETVYGVSMDTGALHLLSHERVHERVL